MKILAGSLGHLCARLSVKREKIKLAKRAKIDNAAKSFQGISKSEKYLYEYSNSQRQ